MVPKGINRLSPTAGQPHDHQAAEKNSEKATFAAKEVAEVEPSSHSLGGSREPLREQSPAAHDSPVAPRWAPHLTEEQETAVNRQFSGALAHNDVMDCCEVVLQHPWLVRAHPHVLLKTAPVSRTTVLHHLLLNEVQSDVLLALLDTPEGMAALNQKDIEGITPLHLIALLRPDLPEVVNKITTPDTLLTTDMNGSTALHYASNSAYPDNCKKLMVCVPQSLWARDRLELSPFDIMMASKRLTLDEKQEIFKQALSTPGFVANLKHIKHQMSGISEIDQHIQKLIKANPTPAIAVRLDHNAIDRERQRQTDSCASALAALNLADQKKAITATTAVAPVVDELDLASTVEQANVTLEESAKRLVAGLGQVGVYGRFICFDGESRENLWSLGDENASLQLVMKLVELGTPHIQFRLSPPESDFVGMPTIATIAKDKRTEAQKHQLQQMQDVALHKLALLLPQCNFDPEQGLPQTVKVGDSQIDIIDFEHPVAKEPQLELSFTPAQFRNFKQKACYPDHYIVIRPYRFHSHIQAAHMDIEHDQNNLSPLNLPPNSLLPEIKASDSKRFDEDGSEKKWLTEKTQASKNYRPEHAAQLADIFSLCRQGQIHTGVIYGLHHTALQDEGGRVILSRWLNALQNSKRPTLVFVHSSRMPSDTEKVLQEANATVINLGNKETQKWLDNVQNKDKNSAITVCLIPDLPKSVFQHLISTTDLPALVEGANTTSHVLETGHPYLSVLPDGPTPIPYEMGYPLEALKAEAFSHKIRLTPLGIELLTPLHKQVKEEKFGEALNYLEQNRETLAPLLYLYASEQSKDGLALQKVTVAGLLRKGQEGKLGEIEKQALLAAVDPDEQAIGTYIQECMKEDSITKDHFAMQKEHMKQSFNDSVLMALSRFAKIKKLDL